MVRNVDLKGGTYYLLTNNRDVCKKMSLETGNILQSTDGVQKRNVQYQVIIDPVEQSEPV